MKFLHSMIRVGNLEESIKFYTEMFGMELRSKSENTEYKYTLAFLAFPGESAEIELTYNWGETEYDVGTAFGHFAFGVDDIYGTCDKLRESGVQITREPGPVLGGTTEIAFVVDPDGYKIELIQNEDAKKGLGN